MKSSQELRELLKRIDHKSYPAYKETRDQYRFDGYLMSIDHVQGDPFASPSKVSVHIKGAEAGFPAELYDSKCKRIALQDTLLRAFAKRVAADSFKAKGSGKSGLLSVTRPGQEVLERTACEMKAQNGDIIVRMEIGFPANGRTINSGELEKIMFALLPKCVKETLFYAAYKKQEYGVERLYNAVALAQDQEYIRLHLADEGLVAFVADGAILPRESGVSSRPMKGAVPFVSPDSMKVSMHLPNRGEITGMGIKKGITLIVGGGYHGKSTLLKALEQGVYDHIAGDGREYVITEPTAVKLRAEDGRGIQDVDISTFIRNLPNGKDTVHFTTEDASGSTSQAANVIEALQSDSQTFLIDEDTSATNFMIRDELMQSVVRSDMEPIIPYIDRVRTLYEQLGVSTILVAGSCGSYFMQADCVIQMNQYEPQDITAFAIQTAEAFYGTKRKADMETANCEISYKEPRVIKRDVTFAKNPKNKIKTMGNDSICINRDVIDLRYVEQLVDAEQVNAIAQIVKYAKLSVFDGKRNIVEAVDFIMKQLNENGFEKICKGNVSGNLALPRKQEIMAAVCRYREL